MTLTNKEIAHMAKKQVKTEVTTVVATTAPVVQTYSFGKIPRSGLNTGTKHGTGGTAGTYAAIAAALKDGPKTMAEIQAICVDQGDKGFARYAARMLWIAPVVATA